MAFLMRWIKVFISEKKKKMLQPSREKYTKNTFTLLWCLLAKLFIYLLTSSLVPTANCKTTPACNLPLEVMLPHKTMVRACHMLREAETDVRSNCAVILEHPVFIKSGI